VAAALLALSLLSICMSAAHAGPALPTPAPDNSLTVKDYVDAGVPPIDKAWMEDDYKKAETALSAIARTDPTQLPRFGSKRSGELFAHIISRKILDLLSDKAVPIDTRIDNDWVMDACGPILDIYDRAGKPDRVFDVEQLELSGHIMRAQLAAAIAMNEFNAAHKKEEGPGMKQIRTQFATCATMTLNFMMNHASVRTTEAVRFAGQLKEFLPKLQGELLPEAQQQLKARLKKFAEGEGDKELKKALSELVLALK
jgi:hypothetical protein